MPVVPLTLTISLTLVFTFIVFFLREHARGRMSSPERDSLLPLSEENSRLARVPLPVAQGVTSDAAGEERGAVAVTRREQGRFS